MQVDQNFPRIAQDHVNLTRAGYYKIDELKSEMRQLSSLSTIQTNHQDDSILSLDVLRLKLDAFLEDALYYSHSFYCSKDQSHLTLLC